MKKRKNMKKRLLALASICVMMVTLAPLTFFHTDAAPEYILSDNFSDRTHTKAMWSNGLENYIQDEKVELSGETDAFLISDAMWDEGNKPTKLSFTAYSSSKSTPWPDSGLRVYVLNSQEASLEFGINTAQAQGFHRFLSSSTGFQNEDGTAVTPGNNKLFNAIYAGSNLTTPFTYTFTYDWSKWDEVAEGKSPQVTVTIKADFGENQTLASTLTFICTADTKPDTFKVGFKSDRESTVLDDVKLEYKVSEARLKEHLETKYRAFEQEKSYATAKAYLKQYELLAATSKQEVAESYAAVSKWLRAQSGAYTDDFSNADKTATLWTNSLDSKIVAENRNTELTGATNAFLISDAMWYEGNKPTKFSFTAYTKDNIQNDDGLRVQLLRSENVRLEFYINTAQWGGYHKYYATGLKADRENLRLWQPAIELGENTDTPIAYTFTYDWGQWDTESKVTVIADAVGKDGSRMTTQTITFTCTEGKPETFKVGFQNQINSDVIDDVSLSFRVSEDRLKRQLTEKYETFRQNKTYQTAREYLDDYELLGEASKIEFAESYAAVCDWLKAQPGSLTDDFENADKTAILWTNELDKSFKDDETVELAGETDTFLISDAMWDEGNRPVKFRFTAYSSSQSTNYPDDGLRVQLLHSENVNLEFRINTAQWGGYHKYYETGLKANRENLRLWQPAEELGSNTDTPIAYTFTYDWGQWDAEGKVTVIADAVGKDGKNLSTETITFTCTAEKPDTFKVGFQNHMDSAVIDNIQVSCKFEPVLLGADAVVNQDNEPNVRVRGDFSIIDGITTMSGGTLKEFGIVLMPGSLTSETMQTKIPEMVEADLQTDEDTGCIRQALTEKPKNWTGMINVTVDNSGKGEALGKRLTAMAYMVFEKDGELQYYYSSNNNEIVKKGALNISVIGSLRQSLQENSDSELQRALDGYNQEYNKSETLDHLKTLIGSQDKTTKAQKELLQYVFTYLSNEES